MHIIYEILNFLGLAMGAIGLVFFAIAVFFFLIVGGSDEPPRPSAKDMEREQKRRKDLGY